MNEFERLKLERERLMLQQQQEEEESSASPRKRSPMEMISDYARGTVMGVPEAITNLASRTASGLVGLGAGGAGAVLPGPEGQAAAYAQKAGETIPTYEPRTSAGQTLVQLADIVPNFLNDLSRRFGQRVATETDSPIAGAITEGTLGALPMVIGRGARPLAEAGMKRATAEANAAASRNLTKDETLQRANSVGLVVPAAQLGARGAVPMSWIAGGKTIHEEAWKQNTEAGNRVARQEASLPPDTTINHKTLKAARQGLMKPYNELANLSQTGADALREMSVARDKKQGYWHQYGIGGEQEIKEKALHWQNEEDFWQSILEHEAQVKGRPDLIPAMKDARVKIAKNYDIANSVNNSTGDVDMRVLGRLYEAQPERYSGGIETLGRFGSAYSEYAKPTVKEFVPETHIGTHISPHGMNMYGWLGGGVPGLRMPLARASLSKSMQKMPEYKPGMAVRLSDVATRNPYAFGVVPALGLKRPEE